MIFNRDQNDTVLVAEKWCQHQVMVLREEMKLEKITLITKELRDRERENNKLGETLKRKIR